MSVQDLAGMKGIDREDMVTKMRADLLSRTYTEKAQEAWKKGDKNLAAFCRGQSKEWASEAERRLALPKDKAEFQKELALARNPAKQYRNLRITRAINTAANLTLPTPEAYRARYWYQAHPGLREVKKMKEVKKTGTFNTFGFPRKKPIARRG